MGSKYQFVWRARYSCVFLVSFFSHSSIVCLICIAVRKLNTPIQVLISSLSFYDDTKQWINSRTFAGKHTHAHAARHMFVSYRPQLTYHTDTYSTLYARSLVKSLWPLILAHRHQRGLLLIHSHTRARYAHMPNVIYSRLAFIDLSFVCPYNNKHVCDHIYADS